MLPGAASQRSAACLIEVLVWRAHSHACASAAVTSSAGPVLTLAGADRVWLLARLIDGLLVRLLHAASEGTGSGHCHGKQVMLALRSTLGHGPLRVEVMRHVGRALKWKHARQPQELHRLHADVPLVAERAAIVRGTRPPTARAVLMLTASLQAVAACALRAILAAGGSGRVDLASAHDEVLAGLLSSHDDGALALLLSDGDAGAARAAGVNPAAAAAVARRLAAQSASQRPGGGEPVKEVEDPPLPHGEAAPSDAAQPQQRQTTIGAGPPPVWLEELQALRTERAQLRVQNEKLQNIVDGMLQPYGNLQPWVEWWSTL